MSQIYVFLRPKNPFRFLVFLYPLAIVLFTVGFMPSRTFPLFALIGIPVPLLLIAVVYLLYSKITFRRIEVSKFGLVIYGRYLPWEKIRTLKLTKFRSRVFLTFNYKWFGIEGFQLALKSETVKSFKYAVMRSIPVETAAHSLFRDTLSGFSESDNNFKIEPLNAYDPHDVALIRKKTSAATIGVIFLACFLGYGPPRVWFLKTSLGTRVSNYAFNITVLQNNEVVLGVPWPAGTVVNHYFNNDQILNIEIKAEAHFWGGTWPAGTFFGIYKNHLNFALPNNDFSVDGIRLPKGANVEFADSGGIREIYVPSPFTYQQKLYLKSVLYFKDGKFVKIRESNSKDSPECKSDAKL